MRVPAPRARKGRRAFARTFGSSEALSVDALLDKPVDVDALLEASRDDLETR